MHHQEFWWRFFPKKELTEVYLAAALRSFALSLLGIFVPLYLFKERGFSLEETLWFFFVFSVAFGVGMPVAGKFSARFGVKHSILASVPLYLAFVGGLYGLALVSIPLWVMAIFLGLSNSFYWMGMHLVFMHSSHKNHRGEEVGKRQALSILAAMAGPLLGGFLIMVGGFNVVFVVSGLFLFASAFVLFGSEEEHEPYHFAWSSLIDKRHWKDGLFFLSVGTQVIAEGVIWPLFVFVILGSYVSLGAMGSLLAGMSAALVWLVGKGSDRLSRRMIVRFITPFEAMAWFMRAYVASIAQVFGVTIFAALTHGIRQSPLGALEYDKAKGEITAYFVSREIIICLGRILMLIVVLLTDSLGDGLLFQGVASLAALVF